MLKEFAFQVIILKNIHPRKFISALSTLPISRKMLYISILRIIFIFFITIFTIFFTFKSNNYQNTVPLKVILHNLSLNM